MLEAREATKLPRGPSRQSFARYSQRYFVCQKSGLLPLCQSLHGEQKMVGARPLL